ncbi:hypothetical protein [Microcoleus vaginatus]|uniref:hypothetical protein n=1 Tax=Microcoleus vaginatus TaxID=119532 RepID=UPI001F6110DA|nr:hypothetical protein D0A37_02665 [Microcoleus vaginatus HSN003]
MRPILRPLTPKEKAQIRREWRIWLRWFLKHFWGGRFPRAGHIEAEELAWIKFTILSEECKRFAQLLKNLLLIPKFCNGLIGVARNDSLPASAALIC